MLGISRIRLLLLLEIIFSQLCYFSVHLHTKVKILLHWKLLLHGDQTFFEPHGLKVGRYQFYPFFQKKSTLLNKKGTNFIFALYLSYSIKSFFTEFFNFFPPFFRFMEWHVPPVCITLSQIYWNKMEFILQELLWLPKEPKWSLIPP